MISRTTLDALRARDCTCYTAHRCEWTTIAGSLVAPVTEFFVDRSSALKRAAQWDAAAPLGAPVTIVAPIKAREVPLELYR